MTYNLDMLYIQLRWDEVDKSNAYEVAQIVADQCLAVCVRRLSRVVTSVYDRALQPFGIKINQASVLVCLLLNGDSSPSAIGSLLQMEKSTVSRTIDRMKKSGWVMVEGSGAGQTVRITDKGKQLMVDSHEQWKCAQKKAQELLGEDGAISLKLLAGRLR